MKKTIFLTASVLVLTGCPGMMPRSAPPDIPVDVTVETIKAAKYVNVSREPIRVDRADTNIVWTLQSPDYEFAANGIEVVKGGSQFSCTRRSAKVFVCVDRNSTPGTYKYIVRTTGPGQPEALDPTIINY